MKLINWDCLIESDKIESWSADLILTDLPYGNMWMEWANHWMTWKVDWDKPLNPDEFFVVANRILRKNWKMVLFSQGEYTNKLINESLPELPHTYKAYWEKDHFSNALNAKNAMLGYCEEILFFSKAHQKHDFEWTHPLREYFSLVMDYIALNIREINIKLWHRRAEHTFYINSTQFSLCTEKTYNQLIEVFRIDQMEWFIQFSELKKVDSEYRDNLLKKMNKQCPSTFNLWEGKKYKSNILKYKKDYTGHHPTQKPVLLLEDLIKTFSNEWDLVVDLTMGSGSTWVACKNTKRDFTGIEMDKDYFQIAKQRIWT